MCLKDINTKKKLFKVAHRVGKIGWNKTKAELGKEMLIDVSDHGIIF